MNTREAYQLMYRYVRLENRMYDYGNDMQDSEMLDAFELARDVQRIARWANELVRLRPLLVPRNRPISFYEMRVHMEPVQYANKLQEASAKLPPIYQSMATVSLRRWQPAMFDKFKQVYRLLLKNAAEESRIPF